MASNKKQQIHSKIPDDDVQALMHSVPNTVNDFRDTVDEFDTADDEGMFNEPQPSAINPLEIDKMSINKANAPHVSAPDSPVFPNSPQNNDRGYKSIEALKDDLKQKCRKSGITCLPEWIDTLVRLWMTPTPIDPLCLDMFILGITKERDYSVSRELKEVKENLSQEISKMASYNSETRGQIEELKSEIKIFSGTYLDLLCQLTKQVETITESVSKMGEELKASKEQNTQPSTSSNLTPPSNFSIGGVTDVEGLDPESVVSSAIALLPFSKEELEFPRLRTHLLSFVEAPHRKTETVFAMCRLGEKENIDEFMDKVFAHFSEEEIKYKHWLETNKYKGLI